MGYKHMEILEVGEKMSKSLGKNGKTLLIGAAVVVGGLALFKGMSRGEEDSGEWITPTGFRSYPDAVTNANVIMGEVNDHTTAEEEITRDKIDDLQDYAQKGIEDIKTQADKNKTEVVNKIDSSTGKVVSKVDQSKKDIMTQITKSQHAVQHDLKAVKKSDHSKKAKKSSAHYYKKTSYKGVSIVDGLKSIGVNSSYKHRAQIAKANGMKGYHGTASQNLKMLHLLQKGKLKRG